MDILHCLVILTPPSVVKYSSYFSLLNSLGAAQLSK